MNYKSTFFFFALLLIYSQLFSQRDTTALLYEKAMQASDSGHFENALFYFEQILITDPDNRSVLEGRMHACSELKKYRDALATAEHLTRLEPENANHWNNAGWYALLDKRYVKAEKYCLKSLELNGCNYSAYLNLGHIYAYMLKSGRSLEYYEKALNYLPNARAFESGFIGDMNYFQERGDYPYKIDPIRKSLVDVFNQEIRNNGKANLILDSIFSLTVYQGYDQEDERVLALKQQFIDAESKNKTQRLFAMRDFYVSLGVYQYENLSRNIAFSNYFVPAINLCFELNDTVGIIDVNFKAGSLRPVELSLIRRGIQWAEASNDYKRQQKGYNIIAADKTENNDADSALFFYEKCFKLSALASDVESELNAIINIIDIFVVKKQIDSVQFYYAKVGRYLTLLDVPLSMDCRLDYAYCKVFNAIANYDATIEKGKSFLKRYDYHQDIDVSGFKELIGIAYFKLEQYDSAEVYLMHAILDYDAFLTNHIDAGEVTLKERKLSYQYLKRVELANKNLENLFLLGELTRYRILTSTLKERKTIKTTISLEDLALTIKPDALAIQYSNSGFGDLAYAIAIDNKKQQLNIDDQQSVEQMARQIKIVNWDTLISVFSASHIMDKTGQKPEEIRSMAFVGYIIMHNLDLLTKNGKVRGTTPLYVERNYNYDTIIKVFNDVLYHLYIKPFESMLINKKTIYISADFFTTLIPFEALRNEKGEYLGTLYNIVYVPSFTITQALKTNNKNYAGNVLAFGDANYSKFNPSNSKGRGHDLALMGFDKWSDLPGTKKELSMIKSLLPKAKIVDGNGLNESTIKALSAKGELKKYDVLHFAVHGAASYESFHDNMIVVSEPEGTNDDGFLRFDEIADLKLNASLVCLSACETAAGLPRENEEIRNLPLAFFLAGAHQVIASWWKVDDEATGLFMSDFYRQVFQEKKSYSEALLITRKHFTDGLYGEKYKQPYYWAAFRYFGE